MPSLQDIGDSQTMDELRQHVSDAVENWQQYDVNSDHEAGQFEVLLYVRQALDRLADEQEATQW